MDGNVVHGFFLRDLPDGCAVLLNTLVELALEGICGRWIFADGGQGAECDDCGGFGSQAAYDGEKILAEPFGRWFGWEALCDAEDTPDLWGDEGEDVVAADPDHDLARVTGEHVGEAFEGVIGEVSADAEVEEAEAVVAGPALKFSDPVECLAFACCAA